MEQRAFLNSPSANVNAPSAEIGSTPPDFYPYVEVYNNVTILKMMVFYNENFGIIPGDDYKIRVSKFHHFFAEF